MNVKCEKVSYNFLTKASKEMGPKRFQRQSFSLFLVKFKKLEFSAPLRVKMNHFVLSGLVGTRPLTARW